MMLKRNPGWQHSPSQLLAFLPGFHIRVDASALRFPSAAIPHKQARSSAIVFNSFLGVARHISSATLWSA